MPDPRCPLCDLPVPAGDDFIVHARADRVGAQPPGSFWACGVHAACCDQLIAQLRLLSERADWSVEVRRTPGR